MNKVWGTRVGAARRGRMGWCALAVVWVSACQETKEHYPPTMDCMGITCHAVVIVGGGGITKDAAVPTPADAGDAALDAGRLHLNAAVVRATVADLSVVEEFDETVSVSLLDDPEFQVEVHGNEAIELPSGALPGWLRVSRANSLQLGSTLRWVELGEAPLRLITVDTALFQDVADALGVQPVTIDPASAHVLLNIRDVNGAPVAGVHVETVGGVVAYDVGATFNDATFETGDRGAALWLNAPSAGSGPREITFRLESGGVVRNQRVPVEPGGLTITGLLWTGS